MYILDIPLSFKKLSVYFIYLIVLVMTFFLMVFIALIYKTIPFIVQCMFALTLKYVLLINIPLCYGIEDNDISL